MQFLDEVKGRRALTLRRRCAVLAILPHSNHHAPPHVARGNTRNRAGRFENRRHFLRAKYAQHFLVVELVALSVRESASAQHDGSATRYFSVARLYAQHSAPLVVGVDKVGAVVDRSEIVDTPVEANLHVATALSVQACRNPRITPQQHAHVGCNQRKRTDVARLAERRKGDEIVIPDVVD